MRGWRRQSLNAHPRPAVDLWSLYLPPALEARPSALSHVAPGSSPSSPATDQAPGFSADDLELWLEFQKSKGKAVSKDTWSLLIDFIRTIDAELKEYDEEGEFEPVPVAQDIADPSAAWPSTIDDFVEYARAKKA